MELGCGVGMLASVLTHLGALRVLAFDHNKVCARLAGANCALNAVLGSAPGSAHALAYGPSIAAAVQDSQGSPAYADLIVGSELLYMGELVEPLWETVSQLLRPQGRFILAHIDRVESVTEKLFAVGRRHKFSVESQDLRALVAPKQHACAKSAQPQSLEERAKALLQKRISVDNPTRVEPKGPDIKLLTFFRN